MISFELHLEKWHEKTQKPPRFRGFSNRYLFRFAMLVTQKGQRPTTTVCNALNQRLRFAVPKIKDFDRGTFATSLHLALRALGVKASYSPSGS